MKKLLFLLLAIGLNGCSSDTSMIDPQLPVATVATGIHGSGFTANWNEFEGADAYEVDAATDAGFTSIIFVQETINSSLNIGGLEPVTEYFYRVRATFNGQNPSGNSNIISLVTLPVPPVATAATNETSDGFTANWNEVPDISTFLLFISEDNFASDPPVYVAGYAGKEVTGSSFNVTGLDPGNLYYYALKSKHNSVLSNYSNSIIAETN